MIKHSFTISLLLMYAPIMGTISTSTSNSTEDSSLGKFSVSTTSPQTTTSQSPATTTQLGSSLNPGTKLSELISKASWQEHTSSSPGTNMTAKTVAGGGTALESMSNIHALCLCSILTLLCILRQK